MFLAVVFAQFGFLGHDAGHGQVFRTRRADAVLGLASGNLGAGFSYDWWTGKHDRHHAHPNTEDADPDIALGVLAFSPAKARTARGIQRLIFRYQAYLVIPMLFLEAFSLHASSIRRITGPGCRHRAWEATLLGAHFAAYLGVVFLVLPPVKAVTFIVVQQGLLGFYLGCSFAPNHKGMPILSASDTTCFLRRQVLTSRNVRGDWLTDFVLGGLNYQIEHHLFPSMPRPNLRRAQAMVAAFCADRGVAYLETSLLASYAQALGHLAAVGSDHTGSGCRVSPRVVLSLFPTLILDHRGDVPDAHFKRERVDIMHAAQLVHEVEHVPHRVMRQPPDAHELADARLSETRDGTRLNPIEVAHDPPPIQCRQAHAAPPRAHDGRGGCAGRADMARSELGHPGERRHDPHLPVGEVDDDGIALDKDDSSEAELVVGYQVVQLILLGRRLLGRWLEGTCGQVTPVRGAGTVHHD